MYIQSYLTLRKKEQSGAVEDIVKQRICEEEKVFAHAKYLICSSLSEINEMRELYAIPVRTSDFSRIKGRQSLFFILPIILEVKYESTRSEVQA